MNATELRPCDLCGKGLCANGLPIFSKVIFQRFGVDRDALNDRIGLAHLFHGKASPALIETFAPSGDVAVLIHEQADLLVCETCSLGEPDGTLPLQVMAEIAHKKLEQRKADASTPPEESADNDD